VLDGIFVFVYDKSFSDLAKIEISRIVPIIAKKREQTSEAAITREKLKCGRRV